MTVQVFKEPFTGGYDSRSPSTLLPQGWISDGKNIRRVGPQGGWKPRKGCAYHHSSALESGADVKSLHQYKNPLHNDVTLFAQVNSKLYKSSTDPPTGGATMSDAGVSVGTNPGFWAQVKDKLFYADGSGRLLTWGGETPFCIGFIAEDLDQYYDRTKEVTDQRTDTEGFIPIESADDAVYICASEIAEGITLDLGDINSNAATLTVSSWTSAGWNDRSATDGTADSGACFAKDGTITWSRNSGDLPRSFKGIYGYWYKLTWSADLDQIVTVLKCTVSYDMTTMTNKWDGIPRWITGLVAYNVTDVEYADELGKVIDQSRSTYLSLSATKRWLLYIKTPEQPMGFGIGVIGEGSVEGATISGTGKGSTITYTTTLNESTFYSRTGFVWFDAENYTPDKTILNYKSGENGQYYRVGAQGKGAADTEGLIVRATAGGSDYVKTGGAGASIRCTSPPVGPALDELQDVVETNRISDLLAGYWTRLYFTNEHDSETQIFAMTYAPYPRPLPTIDGCIRYKGRLFVWSSEIYSGFPRYSAKGKPDCFCGDDSGYVTSLGDSSPIRSAARYRGSVLFFKDEGIWVLTGDNPSDFQLDKLATKIGIASPCSVQTIEVTVETGESSQFVIWQDVDGVYILDNWTVRKISDPIGNYFDPESSSCIAAANIKNRTSFVDSIHNEYHFILPAGELVYNYKYGIWYPPWDRADDLTCGVELVGSDNRKYTYGGTTSGFVCRLETDTADPDSGGGSDTPIDHYITTRALALPQAGTSFIFNWRGAILEVKAQSSGSASLTAYKDKATTGLTLSQPTAPSLVKSGYGLAYPAVTDRIERCMCMELKIQCNTVDVAMEIYSLIYEIDALGLITPT